MKIDELVKLSDEELRQAVNDAARDSFRLRFQHHTGQLTDSASLKKVRKTIARMKTVQRQRELEKDNKQ